ncbi:MAG: hypothetical protein AB2820_01865 [Candidatus Thiodiazotropha sp.]
MHLSPPTMPFGTNEDTPVTVDVLPNDSDPDGDTLTVVIGHTGNEWYRSDRSCLRQSGLYAESGFQRHRYLHLYR